MATTKTRKKTVRKKATRKKAVRKVAKRKVTRKKVTRKKVTRKKVTRKKVARRKPAKKTTTRKVVKRRKTKRKSNPKGGRPMAKRRKRRAASKAVKRVYSYAKNKGIMDSLMQGGAVVAGAIGAGVTANFIPMPDPRIKPLIPIAAGLLFQNMKAFKNKAGQAIALGMIAAGGLALVKQFAPNVPLLAGEDYLDIPYDDEDDAMLGQYEEDDPMLDYYGGEEDDFIDEESLDGDSIIMGQDNWVTPGNL